MADVTERKRFSASRLSTWMTCPLQAKFQYVDELPRLTNAYAVFGNIMHHALDRYNQTQNIEKAIAVFKDSWAHPDKYGYKIDVWPARMAFGTHMAKGIEALRDYDERLRWDKRTVVATEHKFLVPFGPYDLTGAVDLLEIQKSPKGTEELRIVDYKTNAKQPYREALRLNVQFSIYSFASLQPEFWLGNGPGFLPMENGEWWWEQLKDMPRRNIWYGLMQSKEFDAGPRGDDDYLRLYRVMTEIDKALTHNVYVPNISGDSCRLCSYVDACKLPFDPRDGADNGDEE